MMSAFRPTRTRTLLGLLAIRRMPLSRSWPLGDEIAVSRQCAALRFSGAETITFVDFRAVRLAPILSLATASR